MHLVCCSSLLLLRLYKTPTREKFCHSNAMKLVRSIQEGAFCGFSSPVKLREKILNFVVKYRENCMFCRAQVIISGKTLHISWRYSTFLKSSQQRRWSSAISWRQNNGKMAERDRSHVISVLQSLKKKFFWRRRPDRELFLPCPGSAPGQIWLKHLNVSAGPLALYPFQVS